MTSVINPPAPGGGGGGAALPATPPNYSITSYDSATGLWLPEKRPLVDVTSQAWTGYSGSPTTPYTVNTANTDNGPGLMAAMKTLWLAGCRAYLPPGQYKFTTPLVFGDGTSTTLATWTVALEGNQVPPNTGNTAWGAEANNLLSTLLWTGGNSFNGTLITINGPAAGWSLRRLLIDGNSTYTNSPELGLQLVAVRNGEMEFCALANVSSGIQHTTQGVKNVQGVGANCSHNMLRDISIGLNPRAAFVAYGVQFTEASGGGGNGNTCYEDYHGLWIDGPGSGGSTHQFFGVYYQRCDSCMIDRLNVSNTAFSAQLVYDYSSYNLWPAGCDITGLVEFGGAPCPVYEIGTPATSNNGSARNAILGNISTVNGTCPDPQITAGTSPFALSPAPAIVLNTTWGEPYLHGSVTLVAGQKNVSCRYASPGSVVDVIPSSLSGTPGEVVGNVTTNGTIAFTSYQLGTPATVQTADVGTYFWRLMKN